VPAPVELHHESMLLSMDPLRAPGNLTLVIALDLDAVVSSLGVKRHFVSELAV